MTINSALAQIKARLTAATPGPWDFEPFDGSFGVYALEQRDNGDYPAVVGYASEGESGTEADAEFIAAAPTDVARLVAAVEGVLGLHKPIKKWEPYEGAGYTFATQEEALRAGGDLDLGVVAIEAGPQYFEVCKECGRIESDQLSEIGEDWGYRESLWPCATIAAIEAALKEDPQ